ncbi:MAG TPA: putative Ig domain-containing protein [Acidimicrobiia bacterium]
MRLRRVGVAVALMAILAPATAVAAAPETVADDFSPAAFSGNDGTQDWSAAWSEADGLLGGGVNAGAVRVANNGSCAASPCLQFRAVSTLVLLDLINTSLTRRADLSGARWATLSFTYRRSGGSDDNASVQMRASRNGLTWSQLASISLNGQQDAQNVQVSYDISGFIGAATTIGFFGVGTTSNVLHVDDVEIEYSTNDPPAFGATPNRSNSEGDAVSFPVTATDPDGDTVSYSAAGLPPGATINPTTGRITGTLSYQAAAASPHQVTVTAADGFGGSANAAFAWTVANVNRPPTLAAIARRSVDEGSRLTVTTDADDPDLPGDGLTYRLFAAPVGASVSSGGVITWTPSEAQGPATTSITVEVADQAGATAQRTFLVDVDEVNQPPTLDPIAGQVSGVGDDVSVALQAADPDLPANRLTFSATGLPPGLSINSSSGLIWGTTTGPGLHVVTVTVRDDATPSRSASRIFTWTIVIGNHAPQLAAIADQRPNGAGVVRFSAHATDQDGDDVAYSLAPGIDAVPAGATIDDATGTFTWTPSAGQTGRNYTFDVVATDDGLPSLKDREPVTIVVPTPNRPPSLAALADVRTAEGAEVALVVIASDPDGDRLSLSVSGLPRGVTFDQVGRAIGGTVSFEASAASPYTVTVAVTDDGAPQLSDQTTFRWTVTNTNRPPVVSDTKVEALAGVAVDVDVAPADPDGDAVSLQVVDAPATGIVSGDGTPFRYTAPTGYAGTVRFTVEADDGTDTARALVTVVVRASNALPRAEADEYQATSGETLVVPAPGVLGNDVDGDNDPLAAALAAPPGHGSITLDADGSFRYHPEPDFVGVDGFTYTATDPVGATAAASVTVTVAAPGTVPGAVPREDVVTGTGAGGGTAPAPPAAEPDAGQSLSRTVISVAGRSLDALPVVQFPLLLLAVALALGLTVGRITLVPVFARRRRGQGMVRMYDPAGGFGLIMPEDGSDDLVVHAASLRSVTALHAGDIVHYLAVKTGRRDTAIRVRVV